MRFSGRRISVMLLVFISFIITASANEDDEEISEEEEEGGLLDCESEGDDCKDESDCGPDCKCDETTKLCTKKSA
uniref:Putative salivary protein n=1 Tax=Ornithodoros parkeri TaxID=140564 RepID=A6N9N2_ORNPR|nr:putative salivary protein [Ornithodoros parkeri]